MGLPEDDFFNASLNKVCYVLQKYSEEQMAMLSRLNEMGVAQPTNPAKQESVPAESIKSVLKGLM